MTSAPINLYTAGTANRAAILRVFIGPADGSSDTIFTQTFDLIPIEIFRIAGSTPDYAVFEFRTEQIAKEFNATESTTGQPAEFGFNRQVYIDVADPNSRYSFGNVSGFLGTKTIFWGELLAESLEINPRTQKTTITAFVTDYHFGRQLEGEYQYDPIDNSFGYLPIDPAFNPLIDGVVEPNREPSDGAPGLVEVVPYLLDGGDFSEGYYVWVDPEAARTTAARTYLAESRYGDGTMNAPEEWTLGDIFHTLGRLLLIDEEFIRRPQLFELAAPNEGLFNYEFKTTFEDAGDVKNLRVPRGLHLNQLLDRVLAPYGYDWYLSHENFIDDGSAGPGKLPNIVPFRRGLGVEKELKLQSPGEDLSPAESNTMRAMIDTNFANLGTEMRGFGSFEQKELTIELERGWSDDDDALTLEDLRKSEPTSEYNTNDKTEPWRLWVANEAGDYNGLRTTGHPITAPLDLSNEFVQWIPTRRTIDYCLTRDSNGKRRVPYLEWSDDLGTTWYEVPPEWGFVILPDQIGVRFTGDVPPAEMIEAGFNSKLRITGTITGDQRLRALVSNTPAQITPSLRTVPVHLDLSDRFHKREVETSGSYASVLAGDANGADETDDETELTDYLTELLDKEAPAEMRCQFTLHGIHTEFDISDLITRIDGRDIGLNRAQPHADKYVQVFGLRWRPQEQTTELIVEAINA